MQKRMRTYLRVIFAIFARDVKRVLRNPVALVIALGMIVMPSAYAWYVVVANWDPYSNTTGMLVAVANEDAGADSPETGHLDVGAQVVAQLHDNHEMGWEFTDAEAAINGVYEGRYWAALVIPKDFSADFASVFTGDFTQPTIDYYVNEKPSSIAPKVTDAAANAVEAAVNENFVKTVSEKVVETTQKVGAEAEEKADAAEGSLTAGVRSAKETVSETRATLEGLVDTVSDTRTSIARADDTLAGLQDDVPHLLEAIGQSKELLAKARSTVNEYGTALSKNATDGALQLSSAAAHGSARPRHRERRCRSGQSGHQYGPCHGRGAAGRQQGAHQRPHCPGRSGRRRPGHRPSSLRSSGRQQAADYHDGRPTHGLRRPGFHGRLPGSRGERSGHGGAIGLRNYSHHSGHLPRQRAAGHHEQPGFPGGSLRHPGRSPARADPVARRGTGHFGATRRHADLFRDLAFHHFRFPEHHGDEPGAVAHRPDRAAELRHREVTWPGI